MIYYEWSRKKRRVKMHFYFIQQNHRHCPCVRLLNQFLWQHEIIFYYSSTVEWFVNKSVNENRNDKVILHKTRMFLLERNDEGRIREWESFCELLFWRIHQAWKCLIRVITLSQHTTTNEHFYTIKALRLLVARQPSISPRTGKLSNENSTSTQNEDLCVAQKAR